MMNNVNSKFKFRDNKYSKQNVMSGIVFEINGNYIECYKSVSNSMAMLHREFEFMFDNYFFLCFVKLLILQKLLVLISFCKLILICDSFNL